MSRRKAASDVSTAAGMAPVDAIGTSRVTTPDWALMVLMCLRSVAIGKRGFVPAPHPSLTGSNRCQTTPSGAGKLRGVKAGPLPFFVLE